MIIKNKEKCYIWDVEYPKSPKLIGSLEIQNNKYVFSYANSAILLTKNFIPPIFGLTKQLNQESEQLFYGIRDASPDYWGRSLLAYQHGCKIEDLNEITFLLGSNSNRVGNLYFSFTNDINEVFNGLKNSPISLKELEYAIDFITKNPNTKLNNYFSDLLKHSASVGGARPKALIQLNGQEYLAKFTSSHDYYPVIESEYFAMKMAKKVGINVADVELIKNNHPILLIKRFDRENGVRKNIVSALTILDLNEMESRYASYPELYLKTGEGHELVNRIIFNILVGNNDDHARNTSCFYQNGKLKLTPAYDICPYPRATGESSHAMLISFNDRRSELKTVLDASELFGLSKEEVKQIIRHQIEKIELHKNEINQEIIAKTNTDVLSVLEGRALLNPAIFNGLTLEEILRKELKQESSNPIFNRSQYRPR